MKNLTTILAILLMSSFSFAQCTFTVQLTENWDCTPLFITTTDSFYVLTDSVTITVSNDDPIVFSTANCGEDSEFYVSYDATVDTVIAESNLFWIWVVDCSALPVELISFTGRLDVNVVALNWEFGSQDNLEKIIVYRNDEEIATLANTDPTQLSWSFIDRELLPGDKYYQLLFVDYDGYQEYSPRINVKSHSIDDPVIIVGSSIGESFIFESTLEKGTNYNVQVLDLSGKIISSGNWAETTSNQLLVNVSNPGINIIRIFNNENQMTFKVFVK